MGSDRKNGVVGVGPPFRDIHNAYANERETFGTKIVNHQAVQFRLADMATKIAVARQMVLHAATLRDAGRPCLTEAAMAKLYASEMAEEVCSAAIQIHGGYGYVSDYLVEKIWRDVRVCQIYEGTSDVQRILIGRQPSPSPGAAAWIARAWTPASNSLASAALIMR